MNSKQRLELRIRALAVLGLNRYFTPGDLKKQFHRHLKTVFFLSPKKKSAVSAESILKTVIQAYKFLKKENTPTSMLEDDKNILTLTDRDTKFKSISDEDSDICKFYDDFNHSIWSYSEDDSLKYKFKGL